MRSGSAVRFTVTVRSAPSATSWMARRKLISTSGSSLSVMLTNVSLTVPAETPVGSVPKVISTSSSSSSTVSSVALRVNVFDVSPASKVTLAGTLE